MVQNCPVSKANKRRWGNDEGEESEGKQLPLLIYGDRLDFCDISLDVMINLEA